MNDESTTNSEETNAQQSGGETEYAGTDAGPETNEASVDKGSDSKNEPIRSKEMNKGMRKQGEYTLDDLKREASQETESQNRGRRLQLIIFKLGNEEYGLTIDQIKEIVLTPKVASMPQTPDYIKGVANIRGNIIAIMDLEKKFGLKSTVTEGELLSNYTLVVESETFKAGVLVNEVPNTLAVYETDIDNSSNFLQYSSIDENYITGIVKSGSRMIILVDMIKLMEGEGTLGTSINKAINN